jgi:transcriptional repressor NrdR
MLCPFCSHKDSKVIDSRDAADGTRRRRECLRCGLRFTTYEMAQIESLLVVKNDERREGFSGDKLRTSMVMACAKRPLPLGAIDKISDEIETQIIESGRAEVPARLIGEMVMERLKNLDRVAYIRFASVYRDFADLESFKEEIDSLLEPATEAAAANQLSFLEDEALPSAPRRKGRGRPKKPQSGPA